MADSDLERRIETLAQWLYESRYPVVFTGAGISTESGVPDFRGPDGVWTRRDKGLPPVKTDKPWHEADPNAGHVAIVELQNMGRMEFLISQNVDNLHLKSGIEFERLAELHGNSTRDRCQTCEETYAKSEGRESCDCGGKLASSVVGFGMTLPQKDLGESIEHSRRCDLFVAVGSTLSVSPAAHMPAEALNAGAKLVIINRGETPYDGHSHLRFDENIVDVLPPAIERLKALMERPE